MTNWLPPAEFLGLFMAESLRPLRTPREARGPRVLRNLAIASLAAIVTLGVERPLAARASLKAKSNGWGLIRRARLPGWLSVCASVLLLDYTLYLWHILTHKVPWLWRFHQVHHIDRDLDTSTALRFHFGELLLSVPWRLLQVVLIGPSWAAFTLWQGLLTASVLFHHSNVRLPTGVERRLGRLVMTPALHGIHHSCNPEEMGSNWSSGLTLWDRLHGTFRSKAILPEVDIGVPGRRQPQGLLSALTLPFRKP